MIFMESRRLSVLNILSTPHGSTTLNETSMCNACFQEKLAVDVLSIAYDIQSSIIIKLFIPSTTAGLSKNY